jgi:uncharacterized short protein YbdD (DUF466 family)
MYAQGTKTIDIGQVQNPDVLAHTVRHEIGHGVHAMKAGTVDPWLDKTIGMWYGDMSDTGVDALIADCGGWPATFAGSSGDQPFNDIAKSYMRSMVKDYTNYTSWSPARATPLTGYTDYQTYRLQIWQAMPANTLWNVLVQSTAYWYNNYKNFQKGTSGNRLFVNHWYKKWFRMSDKAEKLVDITGDNYSAMSEKELFANCYAEYFANPAGKSNPASWGGKLPADVKDFFAQCIIGSDPYDKFVSAQKQKKTSK